MATYARIDPPTLTNWEAVIDDPLDAEDANKLAQVDLQTRRYVFDFLETKFDKDNGDKLLAAAFDATSLSGLVSGSTANGGTQRQIVQGTVSDVDIRTSAVTTNKIAALAVTSAKLADGAVGETQLGTDSVSSAKIQDNAVIEDHIGDDAVTATQLKDDATGAAGAVTTDHIRTSAITTAKIADNAVTGAKLPVAAGAGYILVSNASGLFQVKVLSGDATVSLEGVLSLVSKNRCELIERKSNGTSAGGSAAATWHDRGASTISTWVENWRTSTSAFITVDTNGKITFSNTGTFVLSVSAPGYKCGKHIIRVARYNVSNVLQETYYGSSEVSAAADGVQTRSVCKAKFAISLTSDYVKIEHYTEATEATDGLGLASSSGGTYETYARVEVEQVGA